MPKEEVEPLHIQFQELLKQIRDQNQKDLFDWQKTSIDLFYGSTATSVLFSGTFAAFECDVTGKCLGFFVLAIVAFVESQILYSYLYEINDIVSAMQEAIDSSGRSDIFCFEEVVWGL
ncbi:MAG: hypothetical protein RLN62_03375 [Rickettsiales bacterium]